MSKHPNRRTISQGQLTSKNVSSLSYVLGFKLTLRDFTHPVHYIPIRCKYKFNKTSKLNF